MPIFPFRLPSCQLQHFLPLNKVPYPQWQNIELDNCTKHPQMYIPNIEQPCHRLDVHLPYGCGNQGKDEPLVLTIITFDIDDIPEEDFLLHVCATVGVEQAQAKLGWKNCNNSLQTPCNG
ncbi:hypothetical protein L208DRAFT_1375493 [Tricholoma matsutake]|nr:hypothetical protein L208DRAFT_1375493 [Tricholoma matsutake 945]